MERDPPNQDEGEDPPAAAKWIDRACCGVGLPACPGVAVSDSAPRASALTDVGELLLLDWIE